MRRLAALALIAGCTGASDDAADDPSVDYRLFVISEAPDLTVLVEGVVGNPYERRFDDLAALEAESIDVELGIGELVVDRLADLPRGLDCDGQPIEAVMEDACATSWGELRWGSTTLVTTDGGGCHFDGFCAGACDPAVDWSCPDAKCGLSRPALDPPWSKVECVPAGAAAPGEACTWTAREDGRFIDDCVRDAVCVDGLCRALCEDGESIAGFPREIRACTSGIR